MYEHAGTHICNLLKHLVFTEKIWFSCMNNLQKGSLKNTLMTSIQREECPINKSTPQNFLLIIDRRELRVFLSVQNSEKLACTLCVQCKLSTAKFKIFLKNRIACKIYY